MLTRMAPTLALASCKMHHWAQLGDQMPTRSPVHAQCDQGAGIYFDLFGQLPPAVTQALVAGHQGLAVATAGNGGIEGLADGLGQQGSVLATAGIARLTHGCPFLWLFWARLKQAGILWRRFTFT